MENIYDQINFVDIGMNEVSKAVATAIAVISKPTELVYHRLRPLLSEVIGNNIIRPLMSPRRVRCR